MTFTSWQFGFFVAVVLAMRDRWVWFPAGIVFNLLLLAFFKYKFLFFDPAWDRSRASGPF